MTKPRVLISAQSQVDIAGQIFGRKFIEALCVEPRLIPEQLGWAEEYTDPFLSIDDFVTNWWAMDASVWAEGEAKSYYFQGPDWRRRSKITSHGMVRHASVNNLNYRIPSLIWFEARWDPSIDFQQLFDAWLAIASMDVAMLHVFHGNEGNEGQFVGEENKRHFRLGSFGGRLKPGLPNIGWAMAYGAKYKDEVDVNRIRSAGFSVDELNGAVVVRVTEKLSDVINDFAEFSRRRALLKSMFRPDFFWIKDEPFIT